MNKVKTGLNDLDNLLGGGFPGKTVLLVSGDAGSGKTLFALNFLVQSAKEGEKCCYISLGEKEDELIRACNGISSLQNAENYIGKNLIFKHIKMTEKTDLEEFTNLISMYPNLDKIVVDNVNRLMTSAPNSRNYRINLMKIIEYLKEKSNCSLLLCESKGDSLDSGHDEAFEVDGVINLSFIDLEEKPMRTLSINKLRYSIFEPRVPYEFLITNNNISMGKRKVI